MTASKSKPAPSFENVFARAALHKQLENVPDVTLNHEQAAFFLGCHPKKLERWRTEKRPPFPIAMNAAGKSGVQVQYRVGTLLDFIRVSQIEAQTSSGTPYTTQKVVNGKRVTPNGLAWIANDSITIEDLAEPFFMNIDGLVIAHGLEESASAVAERLEILGTAIDWMTWDHALASVWEDEKLRLRWLALSDATSPSLREAVHAKRAHALAKK